MKKTMVYGIVAAISFSSAIAGGKLLAPATAPIAAVIPANEISPLPLYIGLGLVAAGESNDCPCFGGSRIKDTTYGGIVRVGWDFNPYVGLEARYLSSNIEKDVADIEHYGIFLKPQYHFAEQSNLYALVGYGRTNVTGCPVSRGDIHKNGLSYGIGFEYDFGKDTPQKGRYGRAFDGQGDQEQGWGMWIDFQHLLDDEGVFRVDTNVLSIGITYDFD